MKYDVIPLSEAHQQVLDETPEPDKVQVILLDDHDLPVARGTAILPLLLGVGVFWPSCPIPTVGGLTSARSCCLTGGETLKLKQMNLCPGDPPHYDFWVSAP